MEWLVYISFFVCLLRISGGAVVSVAQAPESPPIVKEDSTREKEASSDAECLAGSEWESNCHYCRCSDSGVAECLKQNSCDSDVVVEPLQCKPNTTFQRDCNTCVCLENGQGLCTINECLRLDSVALSSVPNKSDLQQGKDCAPGTRWVSQCNQCHCSARGESLCTRKACIGVQNEPLLNCAPGSMWRKDCNTCRCTSNGVAMCSLKGCKRLTESESKDIFKTRSFSNREISLQVTPEDKDLKVMHPNPLDYSDYAQVVPNVHNSIEHRIIKRSPLTQHYRDRDYGVNLSTLEELWEEYSDSYEYSQEVKESLEDVLVKRSLEDVVQHSQVKRSIDDFLIQHSNVKRKRSPTCKPNQEFVKECNTCRCSADGQRYSCTQNECMADVDKEVDKQVEVFMESEGADHIEQTSVCKPRGTFYIGCNTCLCNFFGTDYSCTNNPCPLPQDVELFHELKMTKTVNNSKSIVCVANRMFIKDCNTCWCNEDGTSYFCTRRVCVPDLPDETEDKPEELRIIERECRPDEVFELDCNMCICNSDGKSFSCTRRICLEPNEEIKQNPLLVRKTRGAQTEEPIKPTKGPPKNCQPGQEFRLDCNKCLCDNEGENYSCTRIDCAAINSNPTRLKRNSGTIKNVTMECTPGAVFDRDCNVCRCTKDGHHAICTIKTCKSPNKVEEKTEADPGFRCEPGENFKRDCNDCTCAADGKSVFCTLRLCVGDVDA